jgi:uncharacterized damage-inducible protein DinB
MSPDDPTELREYLTRIRDLLPALPLDARIGGGATAGQLAFHAAESADWWTRQVMLGDARPRDRESEFAGERSLEDLRAALDRALAACDELARRRPDLAEFTGARGGSLTVLRALVHATAHTAEHVGHLESAVGGR